ncbi:MAG: tetratricopeptide repeat protein [Candidatus Aegiribacteria sp.]|nr:tetratricopeptide repeat protein [Candidatus Aegiribacteria sp.]
MADKPETENNDHTMEELITGIGKLVYKLNESVVNIDRRIEKLETGISSLLLEKFESLTAELVKSNEHLAGLREDLGSFEEKLLKVLAEGSEDSIKKEQFSKELSEVSMIITESASSIQKTVTDVIGQSNENRGVILSENMKILSDGIGEISSKMDQARDSIQEKLKEIQASTVEEVVSISSSLKESAENQKEQLEQMRDLLTLHSVEVKDNRVRSLNRSAIVHFNNAEFDQASSDLKEAIELSPDSSELLANMAHIEASQGKLKEAEEHFRKALEINPELEPAISGLGTVLVITGRAGDTIDFLQKHLEENSEASTSIMIALSRAYVSQGEHAKALAVLEKAEKIAPGHPELEQELAKYRD